MLYFTKALLVSWAVFVSAAHITCSRHAAKSVLADADQYITWTINGSKGTLAAPTDAVALERSGNNIRLVGTSPDRRNGVYIIFRGNAEGGTYTAIYSGFSIDQKDYSAAPNALRIVLNGYDKTTGYITGTFSGTVTDVSASNPRPVSGNFRVRNP